MLLKEISAIDVYTRWWLDTEVNNPYYARKIVVTLANGHHQVYVVKETWGQVDNIENDHLERILGLPKSVHFAHNRMFRTVGYRSRQVHQVQFTYHEAKRVWKEKQLDNPLLFRTD